MDTFLVGATLMIVAFGFYELFIIKSERQGRRYWLPSWLKMHDLEDLKARVVSMLILVAAITFVDRTVEAHDEQEVLFLGIGISIIIAALTAFLWFGKRRPPAADSAATAGSAVTGGPAVTAGSAVSRRIGRLPGGLALAGGRSGPGRDRPGPCNGGPACSARRPARAGHRPERCTVIPSGTDGKSGHRTRPSDRGSRRIGRSPRPTGPRSRPTGRRTRPTGRGSLERHRHAR